ncbi:DUF2800 domain-containing protein [Acetobacterium malicum]|uniref:DUF2800 domain-containing protein n=1 Tax=Acetobacterium malicum TaxID=52692 RepID=UPI0035947C4D
MGEHALLSASSSKMWLHCSPSIRLGENFSDKGSDYAAEGTDAHTLCEYKLKTALGIPAIDPTDDLTYYNQEMDDCANGYAAYILELVETVKQTCSDPIVLIEQRIDFSQWVEGGFGTADCIVVADGILHVVDYKHGQGILVDAEDNSQMKLYALGACQLLGFLFEYSVIHLHVYQPRKNNISSYETFKESLYQWADKVLRPTAALAFAGEGEFSCGSWCHFCKAKHECRARAEHNLELAKYDFKLPPLLTDGEVEAILSKVDDLVSWASAIKDYALQAAVSGKQWHGLKLVEGRSNRKYADETAVVEAVNAVGFDPYEHKVLGITAMQKLLGKSQFDQVLGNLIEKPQGKPTLVPESDKRPAIHTAQHDFNEI